ncbi:MAG: GntR family transcriptional regulator [Capsulimonas sp.]|jgi:DNA-binding transcriptional MocR family regulator|nr:GntR family transcriptional regulator [Capsulimonas sp.]
MITTEDNGVRSGTLYEEVAARVTRLIDEGTFQPGDRLSSVRKLSQQLQVSISTVMEAYRVLEDRGLIEARPQSGYYVRLARQEAPAEPEVSRPSRTPTAVSLSDFHGMLMRDIGNPNLLHLGAAIPNPELLPIGKLSRTIAAVTRRHGVLSVAYNGPLGAEALRVQIARRALGAGCTLSPDQILTTCGSQEAISLALRAVCQPGDTVAIESPVYYGILQCIEQLGLRALEIPTSPRTGISLEALRYALGENEVSACVVVSNFSNPLGGCMPDDHKRELVEMLSEREIPLIEDDIYGDIGFADERPKTCKAFDRDGWVILCSSYSKTLAPGYRVGWAVAGRFMDKMTRLKLTSSLACPTPTQLAVADFLANGGYDHHLRKIRKVYARQVLLMGQAVGRAFPAGTCVTRPEGGYVLWVECPPRVDALKLYEWALTAGMTIAPGPLFSAKQKYRNCIRLNAAFWSEDVERAIVRLGQTADTMGK